MVEHIVTGDGSSTLKSNQFEALYHSKHGAIQESQVVFIAAGLQYQLTQKNHLEVLEMGFGTGLNALLTYLEVKDRPVSVRYTGVEAYPIPQAMAESLNYVEQLQGTPEDQAVFLQLHAADATYLELSDPFAFRKLIQPFEAIEAEAAYDLLYYDAFAPAVQPQLWDAAAFQRAFRALRPGGVLTTYCAKGVVKRTLKACGFEIEALPGPIGKREITRAIKPL